MVVPVAPQWLNVGISPGSRWNGVVFGGVSPMIRGLSLVFMAGSYAGRMGVCCRSDRLMLGLVDGSR